MTPWAARGALAAWLAVSAGCGAPAAAPAARLPGPPAWLPPYSAAQRGLLEPEGGPPLVPARRTYPDLSRFTYVRPRPLEDPTEAMRFLRVVLGVLEESPRVYLVGEAPAELANEVAQYGPPPPLEPDGLLVARRDARGMLALSRPTGAAQAAGALDRAAALVREGRRAEAAQTLREAARRWPDVPALWVELGEVSLAEDLDAAEGAFARAVEVDETLASAHLGVAAVRLSRGDRDGGQLALARALALHPPSPRALHLASLAISTDGPRRPRPFAIFLDVDRQGAVRVATEGSLPARSYAGCRAIARFEPEVRELLVGRTAPYHLGLPEELACLEAALGAYLAHRDGGGGAEEESLETLLAIARAEGLTGYAMFEILGRHRPERARLAPPEVRDATIAYVLRRVLGAPLLAEPAALASAAGTARR